MDATHHAKIVDKLMQYRGKIPKDGQIGDRYSKEACRMLRYDIDNLIIAIENFAVEYDQGLIE